MSAPDEVRPIGFGTTLQEPSTAETTVTTTPVAEPTPPGPENRRHALTAACSLANGIHLSVEEMDTLLAHAERFEGWLNRE